MIIIITYLLKVVTNSLRNVASIIVYVLVWKDQIVSILLNAFGGEVTKSKQIFSSAISVLEWLEMHLRQEVKLVGSG